MAGFVASAASAQRPTSTDQSGTYLAGLRPPHEHHKQEHAKTSHVSVQHKATTKIARPETKRRPTAEANSKAHRAARLAERINSRVAWPSAEPAAADEQATPETVLQFATEDTAPVPAAAPRPAAPVATTATAKPARPAKIAATDERNDVDPAADKAPTASTPVRTERFEAPASSQMRVIMPAPGEAPVIAPTPKDQGQNQQRDQPPLRSSSSTAQMLTTLAGAIMACVVAFVMFGFGPTRKIKVTRI